ncbi:MAG: phage portal protein [Gammaproteobacteria bacterium]|nr:MAG: phage portal protein [Gammaproteobacteria bacterium]
MPGIAARSNTGRHVDEPSAMASTAVGACVRLISETIATLPLHIHEVSPTGSRSRVRDDRIVRLLHRPNEEMDEVQLRETLTAHALTWGNGYAEIERDGLGRPVRLWPLLPDRTFPKRDVADRLYYRTTVRGEHFDLPAENVLHLAGPGWDGVVGYSPLRLHAEAVGLSQATEEFGARWFGGGARPGGILSHPGRLSEQAKRNLSDSWQDAQGGLTNAHRTAILEEGMSWTAIGIPPEDSQFLETRKFQVEEIARIYRVPLHLIQHQEKSTSWGSGIEELGIGFVTYSLQPWLTRWEQRIKSALIEEDNRYAKHSVEGLLRGSTEKRADFYVRMVQHGIFSPNEVRELEDRNPVPGGDAHYVPANLLPMGQPLPEPAPPAPPEDNRALKAAEKRAEEDRSLAVRRRLRQSFLPLFTRAARRVTAWEVARIRAALRRMDNPADLAEWVTEEYERTAAHVRDQFREPVQTYAGALSAQIAPDHAQDDAARAVNEFAEDYLDGIGHRWTSRSANDIRNAVRDTPSDGLLKRLDEIVERWEETRADSFTQDEVVQATGSMSRVIFAAAGVVALKWRANPGACAICDSMDGRISSIEGSFLQEGETVAGEEGQTPLRVSRSIAHPPLHRGCTCDIVPE